jgi:hypothetical protein
MSRFKVVRAQDLIELPSYWQLTSTKEAKCAESLEDALNRMSREGWHFVSTFGGMGSAYLIFQSDQSSKDDRN